MPEERRKSPHEVSPASHALRQSVLITAVAEWTIQLQRMNKIDRSSVPLIRKHSFNSPISLTGNVHV